LLIFRLALYPSRHGVAHALEMRRDVGEACDSTAKCVRR